MIPWWSPISLGSFLRFFLAEMAAEVRSVFAR